MNPAPTENPLPSSPPLLGEYSFFWFLEKLAKRKWLIAFVMVAGLVTGIIYSHPYFSPPKYEAEAVLFGLSTQNYEAVFLGSLLRDSIIERFDLAKHYNIDVKKRGGKKRLQNAFLQNLTIQVKNHARNIQIIVQDRDPEMAAEMANEMGRVGIRICNRLYQESLPDSFRNRLAYNDFYSLLDAYNQTQKADSKTDSIELLLQKTRALAGQTPLFKQMDALSAEIEKIGEQETPDINAFNKRIAQQIKLQSVMEKLRLVDQRLYNLEEQRLSSIEKAVEAKRTYKKLLIKYWPADVSPAFIDSLEMGPSLLKQLLALHSRPRNTVAPFRFLEIAGPNDEPIGPNRLKIVLLCVFFSFLISVCAVFSVEFLQAEWKQYRLQKDLGNPPA